MPWDIRRDLHIDIDASYGRFLLTSATDSSLRQPAPDFILGDSMPVRFHFWTRNPDGTLTAADPGATTTFRFSGRPAGAPTGSDLLFLTTTFTQISAGVWEGTLNLATTEFADHLAATPVGAKVILGELEIRDATNTKRNSFQFDLTARPQVYDNEDTPLALPTPEEWLLGSTAPSNGTPNFLETSFTGTNNDLRFVQVDNATPAPSVSFFRSALSPLINVGGRAITVQFQSVSTASEIKSLLEASSAAMALVTVSFKAGNDGTGMNAGSNGEVLAATLLSGGVAPTLAPPYLRVHGGFLYIQEAGLWKKAALSAL